MKKLLLAAAAVAILAPSASFACSAEDVSDKLAAVATLPEYTALTSAEQTAETAQKVADVNAKVEAAKGLVAEGNTDGACQAYAEVETLLGVAPAAPEAAPAEAPAEAPAK